MFNKKEIKLDQVEKLINLKIIIVILMLVNLAGINITFIVMNTREWR